MSRSDVDWGATGRKDIYRCYRCDPFTYEVLDEVYIVPESSSFTASYDSDNFYSASIEFLDIYQDGAEHVLRVEHEIDINGTKYYETIGTFFIDSSTTSKNLGKVTTTAECTSVLGCFSNDILVNDFSRTAGSSVIEAVNAIASEVGRQVVALKEIWMDAVPVFSEDVFLQMGTGRLDAMTQLAASAGCIITCDQQGIPLIEGAFSILEKNVTYIFEDQINCVYTPDITIDDTKADVINRVLYYYTSETESRRALVELPSSNSYSYNSIGRYKTEAVQVTEETTEADLKTQANTYLSENSGATKSYTIRHAGIPWLRVGDTVLFVHDGVKEYCRVSELSFSFTPGQMTDTTLESAVTVTGEDTSYTDPVEGGTSGITPTWEEVNLLVWQVAQGEWGNGDERYRALTAQNYNYSCVQDLVNQWFASGSWYLDDLSKVYL